MVAMVIETGLYQLISGLLIGLIGGEGNVLEEKGWTCYH